MQEESMEEERKHSAELVKLREEIEE